MADENNEISDADMQKSAEDVTVESADSPAEEVAEGSPMKWCVLRVSSNREDTVRDAIEKKVESENLRTKIGQVLVPKEKRQVGRGHSRGKGAKKKIDKKLYPGYIFIELVLEENGSVSEDAWFAIKETPGVGNFIGSTGRPVPMAQEDVDKMLQQVEKAEEGEPISVDFNKGDQVKIKEGAFENFEGVVDEILPDRGLARVITTIFGRPTPVELEFWQIEKP